MARVSGEILIERPVEEVFDFVADQRNEPIYNPRMLQSEKITRRGRYTVSSDGKVRAASGRNAHRGHGVPEAQQVRLTHHDVLCRC
jgi:hypothetical protein